MSKEDNFKWHGMSVTKGNKYNRLYRKRTKRSLHKFLQWQMNSISLLSNKNKQFPVFLQSVIPTLSSGAWMNLSKLPFPFFSIFIFSCHEIQKGKKCFPHLPLVYFKWQFILFNEVSIIMLNPFLFGICISIFLIQIICCRTNEMKNVLNENMLKIYLKKIKSLRNCLLPIDINK